MVKDGIQIVLILKKTPKYTCLMGKIVEKDQGQTLFASQLASYEALDQKTKNKIQNLVGIFSSAGPISANHGLRERQREELESLKIL